VKPDHKKE